jgi:hypothetical protein
MNQNTDDYPLQNYEKMKDYREKYLKCEGKFYSLEEENVSDLEMESLGIIFKFDLNKQDFF